MAQVKPILAKDDTVPEPGAMPFPDPKVREAEAALKKGEKAKTATERSLAETQRFNAELKKKHPDLNIRGLTSIKAAEDTVPEEPPVAAQPRHDIPAPPSPVAARPRHNIQAPPPPPPTKDKVAVTPAVKQTQQILAKDDTVAEEPSGGAATVQRMEMSPDQAEPVGGPDRLKFLNPDEVRPWLDEQNAETINTLYGKLKKVSVPTGDPKSEQAFFEQQKVDGMDVPMTGPEPDWGDVLGGTTQEKRRQAQLDKKKAFISNTAEEKYKQRLNPEARKKYVADKVRYGQPVTSLEQKLQEYGARAIYNDLEDVTNPKSDLRLGKEFESVTVGEPATGQTATVDKPISEWEAVSYMLELDGWDKEGLLYKYHEMTKGRDWIAMQKVMASGLGAGALYMNALESTLNFAYENNITQNINKFISPTGRKLFTDDIAKDMSNFGDWAMFVGLEVPELIAPFTSAISGMTIRALKTGAAMAAGPKVARALGKVGGRFVPAIPAAQRGAKVINAINKGEFKDRHYKEWLRWKEGGKQTPGSSRVQTYFGRLDKIEDAKKVARANSEIQQELLAGTRDRIKNEFDIDIVDEIKGRLVINPERLREAGTLSTRKAFDASDRTVGQKITGSAGDIVQADKLAAIRTGTSEIADPMLNPEMFEQMIAVTADLRKAFPDALKTTGDKRLIDRLFDLTVNKDLLGENAPQLQKILDKYNISFENYSLAIVGSGSKAGKVLNKLSQLKRLRTGDEVADEARKASEEAQGSIRRWVMRIENIRRGLLVSQFATAARNLSSAGIRMPLEALGNVMDNVLYASAEGGMKAGIKTTFSGENWKGSFRGLTYMFSNPRTAKEYTDLILEHPQLDGQFKQLFTNLNEIQKLTGRGSGGMADKLTGVVEDAVSILNIPNRMQEYLVRRSMFMGEMERLVKREWGINLLDEVGAGKLDELMSRVDIPKGKMSFADMAQAATSRALDVTYAKQPDVAAFKTLSTFITRNGLTVAMPFPRFMFNGMELVGQYAGGASIPITKYVHHLIAKSIKRPFKKPLTLDEMKAGKTAYADDAYVLTAKDRQRISRNILGVGAIAAAYAYRTDESAPSDYKKLNADDGHTIDTSPQFPLRQILFIGEAVKQLIDPLKGPNDKRSLMERVDTENLANWFSGDKGNIAKEFAQTFIGSNIRSGVGDGIVSEIMDLYKGVTGSKTGLIDSQRAARSFGRLLGNYLSSWAVPLAQIVDVQRAIGWRPSEKKDAAREPVIGDAGKTFVDNLTQPWRARVGVNPFDTQAEKALRRRQEIATDDPERKRPAAKILTGLNFGPEDGPEVQYLQKVFNYAPWKIGSKDKRPRIRAWENENLRNQLPQVVRAVRREEAKSRNYWGRMSDKFKAEHSERKFVKDRATMFLEAELKKARAIVSSKRIELQQGQQAEVIKWQKATETYVTMPPTVRDFAWTEFKVKHGDAEPDYGTSRDVNRLIKYAKAYWKAHSKTPGGEGNGLGVFR